ncbi:hypothetical protein, partial [Maridesulfovibrio hydrothermalis]|uniref:hypothetical protein n=1 Tax=Maridesulfovibrio hydrothermalis TaxID=191026 RepID=UPI001C65AEC1
KTFNFFGFICYKKKELLSEKKKRLKKCVLGFFFGGIIFFCGQKYKEPHPPIIHFFFVCSLQGAPFF